MPVGRRTVRLLSVVHKWLGLALAAVVMVVSASGALLLLRDPYLRWRYPALAAPGGRFDPDALGPALERAARRLEPARVRTVKWPRDGIHGLHLWLTDGSQALADPVSGDVIARWHTFDDPAAFLFDLHAHLLAGEKGEVVNGIGALAATFLVLSGVLLWARRRRTAYRLRRAWPRSLTSAELVRSHAASGALLAIPILAFTTTGAALVFYEPVAAGLARAFDRTPAEQPDAVVAPRPSPPQPWDRLLVAASETLPEGRLSMCYPGGATNPVLVCRKRMPGEWHPNGRSYVLIDPYTATLVQAIDATRQGTGTRLAHAIYPVHAATVGGWPWVAVAAAAGVGLTWLAAGGTLAWLRRRSPRRVPSAAAVRTIAPDVG